MSSYNENLRSSVMLSLQTQELEQKSLKAQKDASMQTLYYAEAATIRANQQLEQAVDTFMEKSNVKSQAVNNNNISVNLLSSAQQASTYTSQSASNTSVCAANVQIATNAIVKLASNIGGIFSIVQAADNKSDIFQLAKRARTLIEETAIDAEKASDIAMETAMLTSEVSTATVLDKAKVTNSYMTNVLKVTSDEFTAASQLLATKSDNVTTVSATEKKAEGNFKDLSIDFSAAVSAYEAMNKGLNLNLTVDKLTPGSFNVNFTAIKAAFNDVEHAKDRRGEHTEADKKAKDAAKPKEFHYPVKNYYILLVKDAKKTTFSAFNAESLVMAGPDEKEGTIPYVPVEPTLAGSITQEVQYGIVPIKPGGTKGETFKLVDSDGDIVGLGRSYVVFLLAIFDDAYKKVLNTYDDFLSAPSASFVLTNTLTAVDPAEIVVDDNHVYFKVDEVDSYADEVEYRVMLLPQSKRIVNGLLNEKTFEEFQRLITNLDHIAEEFDPAIAETQATIINCKSNIAYLEQQLLEHTKASILYKQIENEINEVKAQQKKLEEQLISLFKRKRKATANSYEGRKKTPGFLFNLEIAELILPSNYLLARRMIGRRSSSYPEANHMAVITSEATDNFGNLLIEGETYLPVILSASKAKAEHMDMFSNNIADNYEKAKTFIYSHKQKN